MTVYSTFMSECDCLEHFYGWVSLDVNGCGWVGKMVKPKIGIRRQSTKSSKNTCEEIQFIEILRPKIIFIIF